MKFYKSAMLVAAMLLGFSSVASATFYHGGHHHGGCGDSGSTCDNPQAYSTTLDAEVTNYDDYGFFGFGKTSEAYMDFDAINEPTLKITSATLSVKSNANGSWFSDGLWTLDNHFPYLTYIGKLDGGVDVFELSSNLFDEVLAGISFTAVFDKIKEDVFWASLTVDGTYCPPVSEVPVPAALWLFGSGLMGFTAMRRRKKTA
ncbi:VPLPA-CTERM sorting domain-containing protein [Methylophaga sulfidovorans]|uniref:VPLPA-CTERM protein sorting domain-containing protein n=1 Tax=Methylophaga sulfidovorans TaxID=45496 RepID=A0A1I3UNX4_9GAMM|nr:VPLPA-CTERM sorting domain-containing protein [Methylophaga sulfidovorans]SFJ84423.1 VPLPA-CTERM protein sorting domain-containing protein [Methylophaga sulfidovorans]